MRRRIDVEPASQHGIIEPGPEVVPAEHRTAQLTVLQLLAAEQELVQMKVVVLEGEAERIEIGSLGGLQRPIDGREHHARTAQMVGLEVVVGVGRSGGTLRAGYRSFGMEHVQQLIVMAVDHHRAVVSQRTVRIAGKFLA